MSDKDGLAEKRKEFLGHWLTLVKEMDAEGPFFLGKEPSLIDFVVAPWAVRSPSLSPPYHLCLLTVLDAPLGLRLLQRRPGHP